MGTQLDILAIGNYLLIKEEQNSDLELNYKDRYELD
jgi:carbamoyltransferase